MPRYFFDLHNDMDAIDVEGRDFPDLQAARSTAIKEARAMICASVTANGKINLHHCIKLRDQSGAVVCVVQFEDAVQVTRGSEILSRASTAA
jgi:hypothetical protein